MRRLLSPEAVKAEQVPATIMADPLLLTEKRTDDEAKGIGSLRLYDGILYALLSASKDLLDSLLILLANRIEYLSMSGDRLKYRRGLVRHFHVGDETGRGIALRSA